MIGLTAQNSAEDGLDRKVFAQKIRDEIVKKYHDEKKKNDLDKTRPRENIVFAVSGKWGEGKSTLLSLLEKYLKAKSFQVIWFNPWKYSQEDISLKRAFLSKVRTKTGSSVELDDLYYDKTRTVVEWKKLINTGRVIKVTLLVAITVFFSIPIILNFDFSWWLGKISSCYKIFSYPGVAGTIIAGTIAFLVKIITTEKRSARIATAEEFEDKFKSIMANSKKVVLFIDDLDRCTPETVKTILDSLRTFFNHPECSYVIAADHTVIERYAAKELGLEEKELGQRELQEGRRFLKKIFDVYWRMPLPTPVFFEKFVKSEINKQQIPGSDREIKNLIGQLVDYRLFGRNPRHVIRFITKLRFTLEAVKLRILELQNVEKTDEIDNQIKDLSNIEKHTDVLAKPLLIEELCYPIYEQLALNPSEIVKHEKLLRRGEDFINAEINDVKINNLLGNKKEGSLDEIQDMYRYLVGIKPQFTDAKNTTIFSPILYFSISGSTGLTDELGPDEANFLNDLKSGKVYETLGPDLRDGTPAERNKLFSGSAVKAFEGATDETEKQNIFIQSLKLAQEINEWSESLPNWNDKYSSMTPETKSAVGRTLVLTNLLKSPENLKTLTDSNKELLPTVWDIINKEPNFNEKNKIPIRTKEFLKQLAILDLDNAGSDLLGLGIYIQNVSEDISSEIISRLKKPEDFKVFYDKAKLNVAGSGLINKLLSQNTQSYFTTTEHIQWLSQNKPFLVELGIYDLFREAMVKLTTNVSDSLLIAENYGAIEFSPEEQEKIRTNITKQLVKSAPEQLVSSTATISLLTKPDRIAVFNGFSEIFVGTKHSHEKRKFVIDSLHKTKPIWAELSQDDIYEALNKVNKFRTSNAEFVERKKVTLDSWEYKETEKVIKKQPK